jgi:hypothetical protein
MRTLWAFIIGGLTLVGTAEARLGESKEQVIERYGKPLKEEVDAPWGMMVCSKDGYNFSFFFLNGKVEVMMVQKDELEEEEVKIFLNKNSSGAGFVEFKGDVLNFAQKIYVESESGKKGVWVKLSNTLTLATEVGLKKGQEQIKKELKDKTDGF